MKIGISVLLSLLLTGCYYQTVNINDIESATAICAKYKSTVVLIRADVFGDEKVICSNREKILIDAEALK